MADAAVDHSRIEEIIRHRSESLNVEFKRWIDPSTPSGRAKIIKAILALRNRNGGSLLIGFDNQTRDPVYAGMPSNVRAAFHVDVIQGLVSAYASEIFEVWVDFVGLDGREHPVITVPSGVRTPVAAKADLFEGKEKLIRQNDVYFRTLTSNGTPSTSLASWRDWPEIIQICLDNREADIGGFLRRQLSGTDVATLRQALDRLGFLTQQESASVKSSLEDKALALLRKGERRLQKAISEGRLNKKEFEATRLGSWSTALIIDPRKEGVLPDRVFRSIIASSNPHYTGWPVWLDSSDFHDERSRPHVSDEGVEALVISVGNGWTDHLDFLWFDPHGEFYLWRILEDDLTSKVQPRTALEPVLVILRVAEAIAVGLALAKALGWSEEKARLGFAFKWAGLKGRALRAWAGPWGSPFAEGTAHDDSATCFVEVPLETPATAIAPYVEKVVSKLFVLFDSYTPSSARIESWVRRLIERRL